MINDSEMWMSDVYQSIANGGEGINQNDPGNVFVTCAFVRSK